MSEAAPLLIELGTEELPPRSLFALAENFAAGVVRGLDEAGLRADPAAAVRAYVTPRRLAVQVDGVRRRAPDRLRERRGPALKAAYDAAGQPTPAARGFAQSCGVEVGALAVLETERGAWLVYRATEAGAAAGELVPVIVERAAQALPIDRRMRWGDGTHGEFVRPVQWITALHGAEPVPFALYGVTARAATRGHRFHAPGELTLDAATDYPAALERAHVLADADVRRARVRAGAEAAAEVLGGRPQLDAVLLDEVTALTEWPVAIGGSFAPEFLAVPEEVLVACMQGHQRYFPVRDAEGKLLPAFIAVANIQSPKPDQVRAGFERVLRARLADARYFWDGDRAQPLAARAPGLAQVVFAQGLGSLADKTARVTRLAAELAAPLGADVAVVARAATLAKADLLSAMVGEFPELQGVMGAHYARHDGEEEAVAVAIREHYLPRFAGDDLPASAAGRCLALADRLDTLLGIFAIGQAPTGERDPFGLRRAALGVARILIEGRHGLAEAKPAAAVRIDLPALLAAHADAYPGGGEALATQVYDYLLERLPAYYAAQGRPADVVDAVLARRPSDLALLDARVRALTELRARPEAVSLAAAHKRIANLLGKADPPELGAAIRPELFESEAETVLHGALAAAAAVAGPAAQAGDYVRVCAALAALKAPVDAFFEHVMVLTEDAALRTNRLALLRALAALFEDLGDLARLQPT